MNVNEALLPCPFCGNDCTGPIEDALQVCHSEPDYEEQFRHTWSVQCDKCTATMGYSSSEEEAIAAWNRRAATTGKATGEAGAWRYRFPNEVVWQIASEDPTARLSSGPIGSLATIEPLYTAPQPAQGAEAVREDPFEHCAQVAEAHAELVEQMRGVYPGDPYGELGRDANKMRKLAKSIRALRPTPQIAALDKPSPGMVEGQRK